MCFRLPSTKATWSSLASRASPSLAGGAEDQNPSPEVLADLAERLRAAGKDVTLKVWDGVGHAFLADYRPSYAEPQAHELWADVLAVFERHLA